MYVRVRVYVYMCVRMCMCNRGNPMFVRTANDDNPFASR